MNAEIVETAAPLASEDAIRSLLTKLELETTSPAPRQGSTPQKPADPSGRRFPELDSIRGLAAVTVVFHHFACLFSKPLTEPHGPAHGLLYPLVAGHESVMLFFLLSGFVLALPYLRGRSQPYPVYLLRRILRIQGPFLAALALSVLGASLFHNHHLTLNAWAESTWSRPVSAALVLQHIFLLGSFDAAQFNTSFWSLVHEMRLSVIFPALFWVVFRLRLWQGILLAVLLSLSGEVAIDRWPSGEADFLTVRIAAFFIAGILLARYLDPLSTWFRTLHRSARAAFLVCSLLLYFTSARLGDSQIHLVWRAPELFITVGAAGILLFALNSSLASRILNHHVSLYLGRISYSLYLIHGAVLFALAILLLGHLSPILIFPIYLALAFSLATLFCFFIEEPFIAVSRRVDTWWKRRPVRA